MTTLPIGLALLLIPAILLGACGTRSVTENNPEVVIQTGIISAREEVDLKQVEADSKVKTSVYASVSSGRGLAIGLGFLLSPLFSGNDQDPVRYEVELEDGNTISVYHQSADFAIGDCVEIESRRDQDEAPPTMRRNEAAC